MPRRLARLTIVSRVGPDMEASSCHGEAHPGPPSQRVMTAWKIASIVLLIAANGFFVAAEFALVSLRRTRVKEMVSAGSRRAAGVLKALSQLNLMLSGTQLGVTLTALGLGAIGEPALAHGLASLFSALPHPWHTVATHAVAVVIAFVLITFFEVVVGELVPKNLALTRPEGIALSVAAPLRGFIALGRPLIWLIERSSRLLLGWPGARAVSGAM